MKTCPEGKILNPATNKCVLKTGAIGRAILAAAQQQEEKSQESPESPDDDRILNPATGNFILKKSTKGRELLAQQAKDAAHNCFDTGLRQKTSTCWINTIFNSLVLADATFQIILKKYRALTSKDKAILKASSPDNETCPLHVKRLYFFKMFQRFFDKRHETNNAIMSNQKNFPRKMIDILNLRTTPDWHDVAPGYDPKVGLEKVINILFEKDECMFLTHGELNKKPTIPEKTKILIIAEKRKLIEYNDIFPYLIPSGWKLNSTCIGLRHTINRIGHAVTGYVCKGDTYVYDSNLDSSIKTTFAKETLLKLYGNKYNDVSFNYFCLVPV